MTRVIAYIDETGDRGSAPSSSPIFGMAAVLVPEDSAVALRNAVTTIRERLKVPDDKILSWKDQLKSHDRRKWAAQVLGEVPGIKVCYVYSKKSELRADSYRNNNERFYNYVAYKTYKSIVWAAQHEFKATEVHVRFGHVKGHDHESTKAYIEREERREGLGSANVRSLRWVSADKFLESQAADAFGGFLKAALWPSGDFGFTEPSYLLSVWHLIRKVGSCAIPLGIMSMPNYSVLKSETWFPCKGCRKK